MAQGKRVLIEVGRREETFGRDGGWRPLKNSKAKGGQWVTGVMESRRRGARLPKANCGSSSA